MQNIKAEVVIPTQELRDDIPFFTKTLGMRMDEIFPADDPTEAVFSGHGLRVRVQKDAQCGPGFLRIRCDDPVLIGGGATQLTAPNGTRVDIAPLAAPIVMPDTTHEFVVRRLADQAPWVVGRAGMHYRDLIPTRLGGSIIASHIRIPDGGPVPDMVHYHSVGFQLIFCYKGWVELVYEDQGPPFRLYAGDCVIQPPEIRHRVLYASDNIEVIEIGVPADHVTTIDHDLTLPTETHNPDRLFAGQRFVRNVGDLSDWLPSRLVGFDCRDTTIQANTAGVADVKVYRPNAAASVASCHSADIHFSFVMQGHMTLQSADKPPVQLAAGDAFVIPPGLKTLYANPSKDLEILEVALPGAFKTDVG